MNRRIALWALPMLALMSGFGASAADAPPINIGVSLPLSGNASAWGQQARVALELAQEDIEAGGLVNGSQVAILIKDDGSDVNQAVSTVRQMIGNDGVAAILGPFLSSQANVTIPLALREEVPFIQPSSAVPGLLNNARPWAVRIALIGEDANREPFAHWLNKNGVKRIAIGFESTNPATSDAGSRQYVQGAEAAGVEIVNKDDPVTWNVSLTDFSAIVTKLKSYEGVDAFAIAPGNEIPLLAKELERQGVRLPVWTGNIFGDDASLITRAGEAVEGWVGVSQNWSGAPEVKEFVDRFRARLKESTGKDEPPNTYAFNFYYAAVATADVLRATDLNGGSELPVLRKGIIDGWNSMADYKLLQGAITIGEDGEARRPLFILVVRDGKWQLEDVFGE